LTGDALARPPMRVTSTFADDVGASLVAGLTTADVSGVTVKEALTGGGSQPFFISEA
jgi:hypothetical protein